MKNIYLSLLTCTSLFLAVNIAVASGQELTDKEARQNVFGWEIMTIEERAEHRAKMRSMESEKELEAYRQEHHNRMQARAKEQGITLPEKPMMRGPGRGMMDSEMKDNE